VRTISAVISLGLIATTVGFGQGPMDQANPGNSNQGQITNELMNHSQTGEKSHSLMNGTMDATFAKKAAAGGIAEVKLGQLAQERGSSEPVKAFGKRMETDHSKAADQLKEVASKNNIALPTDMDKKDQATYDRLSKLAGTAFDRAYARDMVVDHVNEWLSSRRKRAMERTLT